MTTPNSNFSKFTEFDKQKVYMYIGVIDPAESKSGLVFELGLLLHCHFDYFWSKLGKNPKNFGSGCQS